MAKAAALISAMCILAFATIAHSHRQQVFNVEGDVYCDPCRVQFQTALSQKLPGASVRVECANIDTKAVTYSVDGVTDDNGHYRLQVVGDHQYDICQVKAIGSPKPECSDPMSDIIESRVVCTENSGIHSDIRYANPVGFMTKQASPQCLSVIQEYFDDIH